MGIELDNMDFTDAARRFWKFSFNFQNKNELMFSEHKRWVTEKLCYGYSRRSVEECADGTTKDKINKNHVCLVKCRADRMLRDNFKHENWDFESEESLAKLDELDKVSICLHRLFSRRAKVIKQDASFICKLLDNIRSTIGDDVTTLVAFDEIKACFYAIWNNNDEKKLLCYKELCENFKSKIETRPVSSMIKEKFEQFERIIRPILLSLEFRDYKQDDVEMVKNIPFILTYSEKHCLAVSFIVKEKVTDLFGNVISTYCNKSKNFS